MVQIGVSGEVLGKLGVKAAVCSDQRYVGVVLKASKLELPAGPMPRACARYGAGRDPCIWQRQCQVLQGNVSPGNVQCHSIHVRLVVIRSFIEQVPCFCSRALGTARAEL
jgi:hypothetical protein